MLSAQVTRNTQSCFVLNWSIGETLETFLVDVMDVTPDSGGHARVRLLPWCGPKIKKRTSHHSLQHRFPHVGILYLTFAQLLPASSQRESEVLPESRYRFLPLLYAYLSLPQMTRANNILLQVLNDIAYPPATSRHHPALPSYLVPLQTLSMRAESL